MRSFSVAIGVSLSPLSEPVNRSVISPTGKGVTFNMAGRLAVGDRIFDMTQQTIVNKTAELDEFYNRVMRIARSMGGSTSRLASNLSSPRAMVAGPRTEDAPGLRAQMPNGLQVEFAPSNALSIGNALSVNARRTVGEGRKSDWTFTFGSNGWQRTGSPLSDDEIRECLTPEGPPAY